MSQMQEIAEDVASKLKLAGGAVLVPHELTENPTMRTYIASAVGHGEYTLWTKKGVIFMTKDFAEDFAEGITKFAVVWTGV